LIRKGNRKGKAIDGVISMRNDRMEMEEHTACISQWANYVFIFYLTMP